MKKNRLNEKKTNFILDVMTNKIVFSSESKNIIEETFKSYSNSNRYKLFINRKPIILVGNE